MAIAQPAGAAQRLQYGRALRILEIEQHAQQAVVAAVDPSKLLNVACLQSRQCDDERKTSNESNKEKKEFGTDGHCLQRRLNQTVTGRLHEQLALLSVKCSVQLRA